MGWGSMARKPYVVASVPVKNLDDLKTALSVEDADFVELRLDYYENPAEISYESLAGKRLIMTLREPSEGGFRGFDAEAKKRLLRLWRDLGFVYDVELRFVERWGADYDNAIVSIHLFDEVPPLSSIVSAVAKYLDRAFAVKVAVKPFKGYKAFLASLLELGDNVAVMPMGVEEAERIAFALLGSKLVYGYVTQPTAPGQPHYRKLVEVLRKVYG
jgi:3-dehydroquinate dehydratase-1